MSDLVVARNCCLARMLPGEVELMSEWIGLSGRANSVQRFERSNGLDTALYKNYLFSYCSLRIAIINCHVATVPQSITHCHQRPLNAVWCQIILMSVHIHSKNKLEGSLGQYWQIRSITSQVPHLLYPWPSPYSHYLHITSLGKLFQHLQYRAILEPNMLQSSPKNLHRSYFKKKNLPPWIPNSYRSWLPMLTLLQFCKYPPLSHIPPHCQLPKSLFIPPSPILPTSQILPSSQSLPHCSQLPESSLIAQTDNWGSCHIAIYTIILIKSACRCSQTAGCNSCSIISGDVSNWSYRLFVSTAGPFSHLFGLAIFYRQKTTKNYPENRVFSWMNQRWRQLRLIASDPSERRQPEQQQLWS